MPAASKLPRFVARAASACLAALLPGAVAHADQLLASKQVPINGRPIQELRLGDVPSGGTLRLVAVTNGPTAGTTTLVTAAGTRQQWLDPAVPAPTFTETIASGTVFSVGGGCTRGNRTDFPFINNNRPNVLRFTGNTSTVIPALTFDTGNFDSAECRAAPDGSRTTFIFSNRSTNRIVVVVDGGGANDLNLPFVTFSSVKTPFTGGLRPQISLVANRPRAVSLLWMETSGQSRFRIFDTEAVNVDANCLAGTQNPAPTGFTIPRGARAAGRFVVGDFDGNGQFEYGIVDTTPAACTAGPVLTTAGPVAGTGFSWTEPGGAVTTNRGITSIIYGRETLWDVPNPPAVNAGPHPNVAGPFAACSFENTEGVNGVVSVGVAQVGLADFRQRLLAAFDNPPPAVRIFASEFEAQGSVTSWVCDERGLRQ